MILQAEPLFPGGPPVGIFQLCPPPAGTGAPVSITTTQWYLSNMELPSGAIPVDFDVWVV